MFAALANRKLYSVNCHLNMETSDFLGGLRPVRQKPNDKVCLVASIDVYLTNYGLLSSCKWIHSGRYSSDVCICVYLTRL